MPKKAEATAPAATDVKMRKQRPRVDAIPQGRTSWSQAPQGPLLLQGCLDRASVHASQAWILSRLTIVSEAQSLISSMVVLDALKDPDCT